MFWYAIILFFVGLLVWPSVEDKLSNWLRAHRRRR